MSTIGTLYVELRTNMAKFDQGMSKANGTVKAFATKISSVKGLVAGMFAAAGGVKFARMINGSLEAADNIQKLGIRLQESAEALSQYRHVATITGVSFEDVANSFAKMQKGIADAKDGLATAARAFNALGINVDALIGMKPSAQFEMIADAILKIEDPARRTQIAMGIMGRSGSRMLSTMQEGGEGIRFLREEADKLGVTLTQKMVDDSANANDAIYRLSQTFKGLTDHLSARLAPTIKAIADSIREFIAPETNIKPKDNPVTLAAIEYGNAMIRVEELQKKIAFNNRSSKAGIDSLIKTRDREIENLSKGIDNEKTLAYIREKETAKYRNIIEKTYGVLNASSDSYREKIDQEIQKRNEAKKVIDEYVIKSKEAAKANKVYALSTEEWAKGMADSAKKFQALMANLYPEKTMAEKMRNDYELLAMYLEGPELDAAVQAMSDKFKQASETTKTFMDQLKNEWEAAGNSFQKAIGDAVADQILKMGKFKDVAKAAARSFTHEMISAMVAIAAKRAALWLLEKAKIIALGKASAPAAAGVTLAAGGTNVPGAIAGMAATYAAAQSLAGIAHDGLARVPQDGTYLLQKGEKVVSNADSRKLDQLLEQSSTNVNINITAVDAAGVQRVLSTPVARRHIEAYALSVVDSQYKRRGSRGGPLG